MSECFLRETVLNLGIATLLFADAPTGHIIPKVESAQGTIPRLPSFFLPSLPTTERGLCSVEV